MQNKDLGPYIGGFPMAVEAMPTGHRYLGCDGGYIYNFPDVPWGGVGHQSPQQIYTGDGYFTLSIFPNEPNVPVVGACLLQERTGYVFSPIEQSDAFRIRLAPPYSSWIGQENVMYQTLRRAVADHIAAVASLDDR
jgi:hypothetical protein